MNTTHTHTHTQGFAYLAVSSRKVKEDFLIKSIRLCDRCKIIANDRLEVFLKSEISRRKRTHLHKVISNSCAK
jgi:hypothetical protein